MKEPMKRITVPIGVPESEYNSLGHFSKKEKKEPMKRITVPIEVPESEYNKLERFSKLSGLGLATVYKMRERCPECLKAWEPLIKEKKKGKKKEVKTNEKSFA